MYNKKYTWFDKLSDKERKLFFNFAIGYLKITPKKLKKMYGEFSKTTIVEYNADEVFKDEKDE